jgi:hypothetical protein
MGWAAPLALGLGLSGGFSVSSPDSNGDDASLSIVALSATPTSVGDGESFEVTWKVSHTTKVGYVTEMGLFVGTADGLEDGAERDSRRLFNVATTAGAPNGADDSSITCTRTGTIVKCGETNGGRNVADVSDFTFRACTSYVLSEDEVCDTRPVALAFP